MPLQRFAQFAWQLSSIVPGVSSIFNSANIENESGVLAEIRAGLVCPASHRTTGPWGRPTRAKGIWYALINYLLTEELPTSLIHHFFHTIHTSGVRQMHMMLGAPQAESGPHVIECPGASILYRFDNGTQVYEFEYSFNRRWYGMAQSEYNSKALEMN
jgi:LIM-domain binding protein